jgi:glycosyltransferase involved in cell wall biosynthesis
MLKILHIITSLELGGAEKLLSELLPIQKNMGCEVELLILTDERAVFLEALQRENIPVHTIQLRKINSPKNIFEISKFLDHSNFDIIHTHLTHAQYWTAISKFIRRDKKRIYITSEHSTSNRRRSNPFLRYVDKFVYSQYQKIISISSATQNSLLQWIGSSIKNRCVIIENGLNLEKIYSAIPADRSEFQLDDNDTKILAMAARFNFSKDHKTVVQALALLPENYKLLLIGDGETRKEIEQLVLSLNLKERVIFTGTRQDVVSLFKMSDLILHISNFEGFGLGAVEAMASGTPLIASDIDGLKEVVDGGAILTPKGNFVELSKNILLFENLSVMGLWKEKGKIRSRKYDIRYSAEKYFALYGELKC